MKSIRRDDLKRYSFPGGAHILELVSALEPCQVREHFTGQECLHLEDLRDFARRCPKDEPVIAHCGGRVDCHLAGQLLEYAGFDNVYVYEGELKDLRHLGWQERPAEVALSRASAVRAWGGQAEHLEPGGYAEPFGGVSEERLREEEKLSWLTAAEQIEPFWVELSEQEYARRVTRAEEEAETRMPPPEAEPGFERLPPWAY